MLTRFGGSECCATGWRSHHSDIEKSPNSLYILHMKTPAKKARKNSAAKPIPDSFLYRGVRIVRSLTNAKRRKERDEAIRKVIERGPGQTAAR